MAHDSNDSPSSAVPELRILCLVQDAALLELAERVTAALEQSCSLERPGTHLHDPAPLDLGALADALGSRRWDLALVQTDAACTRPGGALQVLEGLRPELPVVRVSAADANRPRLEQALGQAGVQQRLDKCEEKYCALVEAASDCILRLDPEGRLLFANAALLDLFDVHPARCTGLGLECLDLPNEATSLWAKEVRAAFADAQPRRFCLTAHTAPERHFEIGLHPETWREGRVAVLLATLRDVTEMKEVEAALCDSERNYRFAFEQAAIGMVQVDLDGLIMEANAAFATMIGYTRRELSGMVVEALSHPEDREASRTLRHSLQQQPWGMARLEKRYIKKDGETCWVRVHASTITDKNGEPGYFVAQVEDITAAKEMLQQIIQAKEQAEAASQAKSQFLSNMSHELRTPLNAILGMTQLVMGSELEGEQRGHLECVQRASRNLLATVNRLLEFSSLESNDRTVQNQPFDLRGRLSPMLEGMARQARAKGLRFGYAFAADVPRWVEGDAEKILQALLNIVDNAVKFTQKGTVNVGVSCAPAGEDAQPSDLVLQFSVTDTGVGIPRDKQETIFEPFSLAEDILTKRYGGIGLGLAVSKDVVELIGGRIWVRSKPGQGSAFFFTCPVAPAREQPRRRPRPVAHKPGPQRRLEILVAEDEPISQELTRTILERRGHGVTIAEDGVEALELLQRKRFDLMLLDIQMPRMNGLEAARLLREGSVPQAPQDLPLIALTAFAAEKDQQAMRDSGIDACITKPFEAETLDSAIQEVLAARRNPS